jgi:hypothetical protein
MERTAIIQDKHNPSKYWHIKKSKCRHYYFNQSIDGRMLYRWTRIGLKHINQVLNTNLNL